MGRSFGTVYCGFFVEFVICVARETRATVEIV